MYKSPQSKGSASVQALEEGSVVVQHKKSSVRVRATEVKVLLALTQDKVMLENSCQVKSTRS